MKTCSIAQETQDCNFVLLKIFKCDTTPGLEVSKNSFAYVGAKIWNDILNDIGSVESARLSKRNENLAGYW